MVKSSTVRQHIVRLEERKAFLNIQMTKTDSDMFEYFAAIEIDTIDERLRKLYNIAQRLEMKEWNI